MRGLLLYAAIILFVLLAPIVLSLGVGGLPGLLGLLGLDALVPMVSSFFGIAILLLVISAVFSARGTYHVSEHVLDMLPGAILAILLAALIGAVR